MFTGSSAYIMQPDLFGSGVKIYLEATSHPISQPVGTAVTPKPNLKVSETGEVIGDSTNITRRKPSATYVGMQPFSINVSGKIDIDNLGSIAPNTYTMTPGLLFTMAANGHRTYYFYDQKVVNSWRNDPDPLGIVQYPYDDKGLPVQLTAFNLSPDLSENRINYTMTLRQD